MYYYIFPAPVIKQTLSHKHNKHRKTSFLSVIQATPSHCWKRVEVHPAPNQIKCEGDQSGMSAVSAGDCLLPVWSGPQSLEQRESVSGPQHLDYQPRRNVAAQGLTASKLIAFVTCEGTQTLSLKHPENINYKCNVCSSHRHQTPTAQNPSLFLNSR